MVKVLTLSVFLSVKLVAWIIVENFSTNFLCLENIVVSAIFEEIYEKEKGK